MGMRAVDDIGDVSQQPAQRPTYAARTARVTSARLYPNLFRTEQPNKSESKQRQLPFEFGTSRWVLANGTVDIA